MGSTESREARIAKKLVPIKTHIIQPVVSQNAEAVNQIGDYIVRQDGLIIYYTDWSVWNRPWTTMTLRRGPTKDYAIVTSAQRKAARNYSVCLGPPEGETSPAWQTIRPRTSVSKTERLQLVFELPVYISPEAHGPATSKQGRKLVFTGSGRRLKWCLGNDPVRFRHVYWKLVDVENESEALARCVEYHGLRSFGTIRWYNNLPAEQECFATMVLLVQFRQNRERRLELASQYRPMHP